MNIEELKKDIIKIVQDVNDEEALKIMFGFIRKAHEYEKEQAGN